MKSFILIIRFICFLAVPSLLFGQSWITSVSPAQNALDTDHTADILITFNQDIDPATLTNSTIRAHGSQSGWHLSSNIVYNSAAQTATFDPDTDFNLGEIVQVTLTTGIQNSSGDPMPVPFGWSFTVGALSGSGLFVHNDTAAVEEGPLPIITGDWDSDGDLDLAVGNYENGQWFTVSILNNDGNANYSEVSVIDLGNTPRRLVQGDFDNDGDPDIAIATPFGSAIYILTNNGSGNFSISQFDVGATHPTDIVIADFDGSGTLDFAVVCGDTISTLSNDGNGNFNIVSITPAIDGMMSITTADFDGDGDFDLAAARWPEDELSIFFNNGNGSFSFHETLNIERSYYSISSGDVDGDGDVDLLVPSSISHHINILSNNGNGNFFLSTQVQIGDYSLFIQPADYDNDNDLDLAVASDFTFTFRNDGNLNFTQTGLHYVIGGQGSMIVSGDLDNDGDLDLAVTSYYRNAVDIFKNRELEQDIDLSTEAMNFGVVKIDSTRTKTFAIYNRGVAGNLEINSITSSNPVFITNPSNGIIAPGDSLTISVFFTPSSSIIYHDSLMIVSNDPDVPDTTVYLDGYGYPVISLLPEQNAINVSPGSNITIRFSEDMDPSTFTNNTIRVYASQSGFHLSSNINYDNGTRELSFDPDTDYFYGEPVDVTLTTAIKKANGDSLPVPYHWSFIVQLLDGSAIFEETGTPTAGGYTSGMAFGDFDNDGDIDLIILEWTIILVFMNDGVGNFIQSSMTTFVSSSSMILPGDFDGDGDLDLTATYQNADKISIFDNDGIGNFTELLTIDLEDGPRPIITGDYNGDGYLDLIVGNSLSNTLSILINDKSGGFIQNSLAPGDVGSGRQAITGGDFDSDGDIDIAGTDYSTSSIFIATNDGNGNFSLGSTIKVSANGPRGIVICDFNGDKILDLLVYYDTTNIISLLKNNGQGEFDETSTINMRAKEIDVGDLDGDSDLDLAFLTENDFLTHILINDGNGNFTEFSTLEVGSNPAQIESSDIDADGDLDLGVVNNLSSNVSILQNRNPHQDMVISENLLDYGIVKIDSTVSKKFSIYNNSEIINLPINSIIPSHPAFTVNPASGLVLPQDSLIVNVSFTTSQKISYCDSLLIYSDNPEVSVAEIPLFGIGYPVSGVFPLQNALSVAKDASISITFTEDMNSTTFTNNTIKVFGMQSGLHSSSNITYNSATKTVTFDPDKNFRQGETLSTILTTEIENAAGDTMPAALHWDYTVAIDTDSGTFGGFTLSSEPEVGDAPSWIAPFDYDNDEDIDLAVTNLVSNTVSILENNGYGYFTEILVLGVGNSPSCVVSNDFDGNGYWDLAVTNRTSGNVSILFNQDNGNFVQELMMIPTSQPVSIIANDLNKDWDSDLAILDFYSNTIYVWVNIFNGNFIEYHPSAVEPNPLYITSGDINGDSNIDIGTSYFSRNSVSILKNNGEGKFNLVANLSVPTKSRSVAINDLDGDSDLDIAVTNPFTTETLTLFNNDGNGNFWSIDTLEISGQPFYVNAGDLDNDGDLDLAVTKYETDSLAIFLNDGNANFSHATTKGVGDQPVMVTIADLDGDDDLDLAVANSNSNRITILKNDLIVGIDNNPGELPKQFALHQNYPNPFNPATTIRYDLPKPAQVTLTIYNILGQKVRTLVNAHETAGYKSVIWDGKNELGYPVSSGLYIYHIEAGDFRRSLKLLLVR